MTQDEETSQQDIGRPGPWGEARYRVPGLSKEQSVLTPPGTSPGPEAPPSTPVTREDYESSPGKEGEDRSPEPPGGDAG